LNGTADSFRDSRRKEEDSSYDVVAEEVFRTGMDLSKHIVVGDLCRRNESVGSLRDTNEDAALRSVDHHSFDYHRMVVDAICFLEAEAAVNGLLTAPTACPLYESNDVGTVYDKRDYG
jgi:hypothetical protein